MTKTPQKIERTTLVPRGLSRATAAAYIGISTTLFDQMVADGRMPKPKRINSRKIWDRWEVDTAFDELGTDGPLENEWDVVLKTAFEKPKTVPPKYDPADMLTWSQQHWDAHEAERAERTRKSPLHRLERLALAALYEHRGRQVKFNEIKGAGITTVTCLEVRGFANVERTDKRFIGWQITDAGIQAAIDNSLADDV